MYAYLGRWSSCTGYKSMCSDAAELSEWSGAVRIYYTLHCFMLHYYCMVILFLLAISGGFVRALNNQLLPGCDKMIGKGVEIRCDP